MGLGRSALVLIIAIGLFACSGADDHVLDVVYDPCGVIIEPAATATGTQLASIDSAIGMWNTAGSFALTRSSALDLPVLRIEFQDAATAFRGVYDDEHGVAIINRRLENPETLSVVVAHELGHAFGLWHVASSTRRSVMNPGNTSTEPTSGDVGKLRAIWGECSAPAAAE